MRNIRIVLVDDHVVMRAGVRMVLESHPGLLVVGEASNRAEALAVVASTAPDLVLLDLDLGEENGIDLIDELLVTVPGVQVLVLTGLRDPEIHRHVVRHGAMGLVLKDRAVETLIKAVETVFAGEVWFDGALLAAGLRERIRPGGAHPPNPERAKIDSLTPREREVISLIGEGLRNREIAARLVISESTVRHHLTSIFGKLGVDDRTELLIYAYRHRLIDLPR
nr:MAG: DNA-binding response regulator [Chloroflexota bacterium]